MKVRTLLLILFILFDDHVYADRLYVLNKDMGEYAISLILHDDASFEVSATTKYGNNINVMPIAYGIYHKVDSTIILYDILWGNKYQLFPTKNNYIINEGMLSFKWKTFNFKIRLQAQCI